LAAGAVIEGAVVCVDDVSSVVPAVAVSGLDGSVNVPPEPVGAEAAGAAGTEGWPEAVTRTFS
jgi:hypothetical protein